jgi:two-component system KDP operon response regulator KdpE
VKPVSRPAKLLIVSSSLRTGPLWAYSLQVDNFDVVMEPNSLNTLHRWSEERPNLVILDLTTEEPVILNIIRELRAESSVPILVLAPAKTEEYVLDAYAAGADECIIKPISPSMFHSKVKAWLRHSWSIPLEMLDPLRVGNVELNPADRTITIDRGTPIRLTNLEMRLLYILMNRRSNPIADEELTQRVWGYSREVDNIALKNVIYRLRRKLEAKPGSPAIIQTVPGVGYKFMSGK